jgi:hypothetical protein
MTIDEAIKHCEEVAEKQEITAKSNLIEIDKIKADGILRLYDADEYESCMKCVAEHRQLAEWLKELKAYRGILANADKIIESEYGCVIIEGYADVIDQMNEVFREVNADEDSD